MGGFNFEGEHRGVLCKLDDILKDSIGESMSSLGFYLDGGVVKWKRPDKPLKANMEILDEHGEKVQFKDSFPQSPKVEFSFTVEYDWLAKRYQTKGYRKPFINLVDSIIDSHFLGGKE